MPRETAVTIRMSFEEKEQIEARAKKAGIRPSEFIREVALGFADYKYLGDSGEIPEKLQAAAEDIGALAHKEATESKDPRPEARQKEKGAETWIVRRTNELALRMPKRRALAQANIEWEEHSGQPHT